MPKDPNNINIFGEREREEAEDILVRVVREIQKFLDNNNDPKKYAEKTLKHLESKTMAASVFMGLFSISRTEPNNKFRTDELKDKIPAEFRLKPNLLDDAIDKLYDGGFLTKVDKELKEIKHPGRPRASQDITYKRGGGHPFFTHKITRDLDKLKEYISNPQVTKLIHDRLVKSGLIQKYWKFMFLAIFYALREENKTNGKLLGVSKGIAPFLDKTFEEKSLWSEWGEMINFFFLIDEKRLDSIAEMSVSSLLEEEPLDNILGKMTYILKTLSKP